MCVGVADGCLIGPHTRAKPRETVAHKGRHGFGRQAQPSGDLRVGVPAEIPRAPVLLAGCRSRSPAKRRRVVARRDQRRHQPRTMFVRGWRAEHRARPGDTGARCARDQWLAGEQLWRPRPVPGATLLEACGISPDLDEDLLSDFLGKGRILQDPMYDAVHQWRNVVVDAAKATWSPEATRATRSSVDVRSLRCVIVILAIQGSRSLTMRLVQRCRPIPDVGWPVWCAPCSTRLAGRDSSRLRTRGRVFGSPSRGCAWRVTPSIERHQAGEPSEATAAAPTCRRRTRR